jgi:hypothetical protein
MKSFLIVFLVFSQAQKPAEEEVEIKEKLKVKIKERKPVWKLMYDPLDAAYELFRAKSYVYDDRLGKGIIKPPLPSLGSDELRKPWLQKIVRDKVGIFNPFFGRDVKKWSINIYDAKGNLFRTFSGDGKPPSRILWDGTNRKGEILDVSLIYFYTAQVEDKAGNVVRTPEKPIKLNGILWKKGVEWVVSIDGEQVFEKGKAKLYKTELLEEVKTIIKEKAKVKVKVIMYGQDPLLTKKRLEGLVEWLKKNILIPKGKLLYFESFFKRTGYETSRIDFIIL